LAGKRRKEEGWWRSRGKNRNCEERSREDEWLRWSGKRAINLEVLMSETITEAPTSEKPGTGDNPRSSNQHSGVTLAFTNPYSKAPSHTAPVGHIPDD